MVVLERSPSHGATSVSAAKHRYAISGGKKTWVLSTVNMKSKSRATASRWCACSNKGSAASMRPQDSVKRNKNAKEGRNSLTWAILLRSIGMRPHRGRATFFLRPHRGRATFFMRPHRGRATFFCGLIEAALPFLCGLIEAALLLKLCSTNHWGRCGDPPGSFAPPPVSLSCLENFCERVTRRG